MVGCLLPRNCAVARVTGCKLRTSALAGPATSIWRQAGGHETSRWPPSRPKSNDRSDVSVSVSSVFPFAVPCAIDDGSWTFPPVYLGNMQSSYRVQTPHSRACVCVNVDGWPAGSIARFSLTASWGQVHSHSCGTVYLRCAL